MGQVLSGGFDHPSRTDTVNDGAESVPLPMHPPHHRVRRTSGTDGKQAEKTDMGMQRWCDRFRGRL